MFIFFLSNLNMGGGGNVGPVLVAYIQPTSATVLPNDASFTDIDPTRATVIPNDASFTDVDPPKATAIQ